MYPPYSDDSEEPEQAHPEQAHLAQHVEPGLGMGLRIMIGVGVALFLIGVLTAVAGFFRLGPGPHTAQAVSQASASPSPTGPLLDAEAGGSATASPSMPASTAATASPTRPPAKPPKPPMPTATGNAGLEAQVLAIVNSERGNHGCRALNLDSRLTAAARKHSADMAARGYFSHTTPEGVSFATRISNEGYRWSGAAENIAAGQRSAADVMNSWMNSPGHRANILNCGLRDIGIGVAADSHGSLLWTQDFASPL